MICNQSSSLAGLKIFLKPFIFSALVLCFGACRSTKNVTITKHTLSIANPTTIERADELIVLTREMIEQKTGKLKEGTFISLTDKDNQPMIVQFDDLNKHSR